MEDSAVVLYDICALPRILVDAGVHVSADVQSEWESLVAAELASRSQRSRKRPLESDDAGVLEPQLQIDPHRSEPTAPSEESTTPEIRIQWGNPTMEASAAANEQALELPERVRPFKPEDLVSRAGVLQLATMTAPQQLQLLEACDKQALLQLVTLQSRALAEFKNKSETHKHSIAMKNQTIRRLTSRVDRMQREALELRQQGGDDLDVLRHRGRRLTWKGYIVVGLRKSIALVSASAFPLASLVQTSRWTVTRSEVLTWALLLARSRCFHDCFYKLLHLLREKEDEAAQNVQDAGNAMGEGQLVLAADGSREGEAGDTAPNVSEEVALRQDLGIPAAGDVSSEHFKFQMGATYWCGDATNSSIWNRQKLQGLEFASGVLCSLKALKELRTDKAIRTWRGMPLFFEVTPCIGSMCGTSNTFSFCCK